MIPQRLLIPHPVFFQKWGAETPDKRGIGNSETAHIEIAQRMAARGWEVICFAPLEDDSPRECKGVSWRTLEEIDYSIPGYWMIFRAPELLDRFPLDHPDQHLSLVSQDEAYEGRWNDDRCQKLDLMFGLCHEHCRSIESDHPLLKGKVRQSSNGIRVEAMDTVASNVGPVERDPHRIIYASSPDRGLLNALKIFRRLRTFVSDATLAIAYGFDNIKVLESMGPQFDHFRRTREEIEREADQPGVIWLGRLDQPTLWTELRKSGLMIYSSLFRETSCAVLMEAQACGVIPVVSPVWALGENTVGGAMVCGDPGDALVRARFVGEAFGLMRNPKVAEAIRIDMVPEARSRFHWERQVDKYEAFLLGYAEDRAFTFQFAFQVKHCVGAKAILNVGCADDPANLRAMGALNVDAREADPIFGRATEAHVLCDMRNLEPLYGLRYDRIVYGDCLEHFAPEAVPGILLEGRKVLAPGGKIVITVPDDPRAPDQQHAGSDGSHEYLDGVSAVHLHRVPREMVEGWIRDAGLQCEFLQPITTDMYSAWGAIAVEGLDA